MGTGRPERMIRRTWRRTSEKICAVNGLPPGFRLVLIDTDGRVKRCDLRVRSGNFAAYPADFDVWLFLQETLKNELAGNDLGGSHAELRDHRNRPVRPDLTLREVREMCGQGGKYAVDRDEAEDAIDELQSEIEEAMSIFDDDPRLAAHLDKDLLLKALLRYVFSQFGDETINHVFHSAEVKTALTRAQNARRQA